MMKMILIPLYLVIAARSVFSIWCYRCVSSQPGCGLFDFDIRFYWSQYCPDPNDKCVKIIERKGADIIVTRECLSNIEGHRRDIPADRYEGCREAASDPLLAHYVNTSIAEHNIHRQYYDETLFCFCDFDERCNGAAGMKFSVLHSFAAVFFSLLIWKIM